MFLPCRRLRQVIAKLPRRSDRVPVCQEKMDDGKSLKR
jgi:hypothetical protein